MWRTCTAEKGICSIYREIQPAILISDIHVGKYLIHKKDTYDLFSQDVFVFVKYIIPTVPMTSSLDDASRFFFLLSTATVAKRQPRVRLLSIAVFVSHLIYNTVPSASHNQLKRRRGWGGTPPVTEVYIKREGCFWRLRFILESLPQECKDRFSHW